MHDRHQGFVVGSETRDRHTVWTVRVKDQNSEYNGKKFSVASVHGGLELARGLNVHFVIGTVDDQSGGKVLKAVDVCLEPPPGHKVRQSGGK